MADYKTLLAEAAQLPVADRIQLIEALWDSVPEDSVPEDSVPEDSVPEDSLPPLSDQWLDEIRSRSAEFDTGSVQTVPWEQVRADAFRRRKR